MEPQGGLCFLFLFFYFMDICIISISSIKHVLVLNLQMSHGSRHGNLLGPQSSSQVLCILDLHPWPRLSSGLAAFLYPETPIPVLPLCLQPANSLLPCNLPNSSYRLTSTQAVLLDCFRVQRSPSSARWPGLDNVVPLHLNSTLSEENKL